ncbi:MULTISPECIES: PTS galactosamine/N-acetylgalactosamine transporter subunit IIA [Dickeya]|uniref:PTS system, N-acetylgalactosamine-and galactosamine-specific IIA component n=1 Tax=Dickeya aquatica TaxID=1401087 RepID=A0A375A5T4_9GAMM|nr:MULTISPECIES: PTS galactosamine/N-acetylgalactosamine transporter subunit IIA [Dickeya]SLM61432.1 PTS system, N-acetylgalactosamine-and galactosamine-specific IIA component [Dickeya aquatica]
MLGIIISGHGAFASGMAKAVEQVLGEQPNVAVIDFPESSTTSTLTLQFEAALAALEQGDGVVFLTDLLGGTPFRVASLLAMAAPKREVITGINLQLLLEMLLERDALSASEFRVQALACGHRGLTSLADEIRKESQSQACLAEEGI